ncbi:putative ATP-dependent RNA helicase DDX54-like protein [Naja naja]|nr:putative ATP-dependent RNA helicase DDX54-like protein [Naja naja]
MRAKRIRDRQSIDRHQRKQEERLSLAAVKAQGVAVREEPMEDGEDHIQKRKCPSSESRAVKKKKKMASLCVGGEGTAFEQQASAAVLDLMGDEDRNLNKNKKLLKCYDKWKKRNKIDEQDSDTEVAGNQKNRKRQKGRGPHPAASSSSQRGKVYSELKTKEQIFKQRKKASKQHFLQGGGMKRLKSRSRQRVREMRQMAFGRGKVKKGKLRKRM